jgi:CheY-like chemotaxis protein
MSAGLAERGVASVVAASWAEAREWCEVSLPAVILLDLALPDGSGGELISWLHGTDQFRKVGLAVYTATDVDVEQRLEMRLTRKDVFVKSLVPPEVVLERVLQLLDATTLAVAPAP